MKKTFQFLIIDDNADDRMLVKRELRKEFAEAVIYEAGSPEEMARALDGEAMDLVVTDYQLGWTDGLAVLREVKARWPHCPVVMFSGAMQEEVVVQAMKLGLEDYVSKSARHYVRLAAVARATLDRAASESRAQKLEQRLQHLLHRLDVGVFRATLDGEILEANPSFLKLLGWGHLPPDLNLRELYLRPELHSEHVHQLKQSGELRRCELDLCCADGGAVRVSMSQTLARDGDGEPAVEGLVEDISERLRMDAQLRQIQKLESIGRLASGVAHDFNNILTIIQGYAMLLSAKEFDADTIHALQQIAGASERAASLTRQLLAFSRRQAMQVELVDINRLIKNFYSLLTHIVGGKVSLKLNLGSELPPLRGDTGMLEQILMNLAMNARDAMPSGGQFAIATTTVEMEREYVRMHFEARPGTFICLSVSDTGCGITPESHRHLFEPFFTTKDVGKGTGLGLAAVYGIVKQHKGWIEVGSEPGAGTTFRIFFPAEPKVIPTLAHRPLGARQGHETVLLVEDEEELLQMVSEVLHSHGYQVLAASSGKKALEVWRHSRQHIDVLVTDMKMPDGVGGLELAERLMADNPHLKVLYTSGFNPELMEPRIHLREGLNFVQKPYMPDRLLTAIRNCLQPSSSKD